MTHPAFPFPPHQIAVETVYADGVKVGQTIVRTWSEEQIMRWEERQLVSEECLAAITRGLDHPEPEVVVEMIPERPRRRSKR